MRRRDEFVEEENYYFRERTIYLRKHYQSIHLLKAEIRQLDEEKQRIYENYPKFDWTKPRIASCEINDPTFGAVERIRELEDRHFQCLCDLRELERAREILNPEEKRFFDDYIVAGKSISEVARRTGKSWDTVRNRLIKICEKVICRIGPLFGEEV